MKGNGMGGDGRRGDARRGKGREWNGMRCDKKKSICHAIRYDTLRDGDVFHVLDPGTMWVKNASVTKRHDTMEHRDRLRR